jgi:hypothetical protein
MLFSVLMITITSWMCTNIKYSWIPEISCGTEVQAEINAAYALTKEQCHRILIVEFYLMFKLVSMRIIRSNEAKCSLYDSKDVMFYICRLYQETT